MLSELWIIWNYLSVKQFSIIKFKAKKIYCAEISFMTSIYLHSFPFIPFVHFNFFLFCSVTICNANPYKCVYIIYRSLCTCLPKCEWRRHHAYQTFHKIDMKRKANFFSLFVCFFSFFIKQFLWLTKQTDTMLTSNPFWVYMMYVFVKRKQKIEFF